MTFGGACTRTVQPSFRSTPHEKSACVGRVGGVDNGFSFEMNLKCDVKHEHNMHDSFPLLDHGPKMFESPTLHTQNGPWGACARTVQPSFRSTPMKRARVLAGLGGWTMVPPVK